MNEALDKAVQEYLLHMQGCATCLAGQGCALRIKYTERVKEAMLDLFADRLAKTLANYIRSMIN